MMTDVFKAVVFLGLFVADTLVSMRRVCMCNPTCPPQWLQVKTLQGQWWDHQLGGWQQLVDSCILVSNAVTNYSHLKRENGFTRNGMVARYSNNQGSVLLLQCGASESKQELMLLWKWTWCSGPKITKPLELVCAICTHHLLWYLMDFIATLLWSTNTSKDKGFRHLRIRSFSFQIMHEASWDSVKGKSHTGGIPNELLWIPSDPGSREVFSRFPLLQCSLLVQQFAKVIVTPQVTLRELLKWVMTPVKLLPPCSSRNEQHCIESNSALHSWASSNLLRAW